MQNVLKIKSKLSIYIPSRRDHKLTCTSFVRKVHVSLGPLIKSVLKCNVILPEVSSVYDDYSG